MKLVFFLIRWYSNHEDCKVQYSCARIKFSLGDCTIIIKKILTNILFFTKSMIGMMNFVKSFSHEVFRPIFSKNMININYTITHI